MNKYQKNLIDFMKTGEIEIELKHLSQKQLIRLVEDLQQRIDKAIEYCEEIKSRAIDIDDTDFDLGEDFTARRLLNILKGSEE